MSPALVIAIPLAALLGIQLWLFGSWLRWRVHMGTKVGPVGLARLITLETSSVLVIASYYLRALGRSGLRVPDQPVGRPVLCVHGITQNGTNMWGVRMELEARGRPTLAVHLGRPFQRLDGYVPRLVHGLEVLLDLHESVDVVCHSMGGVILRKALAARPDLAERIYRITTLGSPHAGTHAARGLEWVAHDVRGLAKNSAELEALPSFAELAPQALVTTVSAEWDVIVYPIEHAHLPGTRELRIPEIGHCGLITDKRALKAVGDSLEEVS
ncbi:MAG: hypothetical protein KC912_15165 [Proteobacteria bacterium]|nr:hypothetical protein [Pseudomonadota bacterium]